MLQMQSLVYGSVLLALALPHAVAVISRGDPVEGFATFYGGPQDGQSPTTPTGGLLDGACGYGELSQNQWPLWNVVSLGPNNPVAYKGNKKGCGYCIQATCTGSCSANAQPVTLWVTDACPTCAPNQLNLNALSFQNNFNSDLSVGTVNVTFQQVDCTPPGNIMLKVVQARPTLGNYIGFSLLAVAGEGTIASVELQGQGTTWERMSNTYGDVWETSSFGDAPLDVRITDNYGVQLTALGAITQIAEGVYPTGVQFTLQGTSLGPAPSPTVSLAPVQAPAPAVSQVDFALGFVATPAGTYCDAQCFSQGLTASQFKKIGTTLNTYACAVSDPSLGGVISGYQFSNGSATCSVASTMATDNSTEYDCLCQTQSQTQGLEPYNGTQCGQACQISIDGLTGTSVPADNSSSSYVCVPLSETSLFNRFGHTVNTTTGESCVIAEGAVSVPSDQFSCFCLFTAPVASARRRYALL